MSDAGGRRRRPTRPAVFLGRDGVLIEDSAEYIRSVEQVRLISGGAAAVRVLIPVVVVTNQSAVARGYISEADRRILEVLITKADG